MKHNIFGRMFWAILWFSILFVSGRVSNAQVEIPDANLRTKIEVALGKNSGEPITAEEMKTLTRLEAEASGVSDLAGIEYATELEVLSLHNNPISDVSMLAGLTNLRWLHLESTQVSDISHLSGLVDLREFYAANARISDISVCQNFIELNKLALNENSISDISALSNLVNLEQLNFSSNKVADISALSNLVNLTHLVVYTNLISDILPLANLVELQVLNLAYNRISNMSVLSNLVELTNLSIDHTSISDISALASLTKLTYMNLGGNSISDISALANLTRLEALSLSGNQISDISVLSELTNLTHLWLRDNLLSDITALSNLTKLTKLEIHGHSNQISDISALSNLTNLSELLLTYNSISDISALSSLTNLKYLNMTHNQISDVSPLVENLGLGAEDKVDLRGNVLNYPSIHEYIPTLKERGVEIIFDNYRNPKFLRKVSDEPLIVEVRDENGAAFEGVPVNFAIVEGSGVIKETVATDKKGKAQAIFECNSSTGLNTISASVEGIEEPLSFNIVNEIGFDLTLPAGVSFIHIPLNITEVNEVATTIETLSDLYDLLGGASAVSVLITYDSTIQRWASYTGARDKGKPSDRVLTDDLGIIAGMNHPASLRLRGTPLGTNGQSSVMLCPGINLIGIPLKDSRITYISDILKLEGIAGNVSTVIVDDDGRTKIVAQLNDEGDRRVQGGQSFILVAQKSVTVDFEGWGWSSGIEKGLEFLDELLSN